MLARDCSGGGGVWTYAGGVEAAGVCGMEAVGGCGSGRSRDGLCAPVRTSGMVLVLAELGEVECYDGSVDIQDDFHAPVCTYGMALVLAEMEEVECQGGSDDIQDVPSACHRIACMSLAPLDSIFLASTLLASVVPA